MILIAGHTFGMDGRCSCGRRYADILGATQDDVGRLDIAHVGALAAHELAQIEAERERLAAATTAVAGG